MEPTRFPDAGTVTGVTFNGEPYAVAPITIREGETLRLRIDPETKTAMWIKGLPSVPWWRRLFHR